MLEQRIARAWRKHQTQTVTVINLISENTIEHRMLDTLARKMARVPLPNVSRRIFFEPNGKDHTTVLVCVSRHCYETRTHLS